MSDWPRWTGQVRQWIVPGGREQVMATLNRFPLFGLWNRVAAKVLDYGEDETRSIGHAVAVLYAIRAKGGGHKPKPGASNSGKTIPVGEAAEAMATEDLSFGGDDLPCEFDDDGCVTKCLVGCQSPQDPAQTPESYQASVEAKIPPEYLERLTAAMRELLATYKKAELQGALIYAIYDDWKRACSAGRRVDLDKLVDWLQARANARRAAERE